MLVEEAALGTEGVIECAECSGAVSQCAGFSHSIEMVSLRPFSLTVKCLSVREMTEMVHCKEVGGVYKHHLLGRKRVSQ